MYSIIEHAGFQYKVAPGDTVQVPTLEAEEGKELQLEKVVLFSDGKETSVGRPYVSGAFVKARVTGQGKYDKVIIFKKKRRETYQKKTGHRQKFTSLFVTEIGCGEIRDVYTPREPKPRAAEKEAPPAAAVAAAPAPSPAPAPAKKKKR